MTVAPELAGLRVFVAEDEVLLSMLLEEMLDDLACTIVGPYATLSAAMAGAAGDDFDVALVDLNLVGESAEPVLEALATRGVPFAIASGAATSGYSIVLNKPYGFDDLVETMTKLKEALGA